MRILLVEDNELIALGILAGLRAHGFVADGVGTAAQAEAALATLDADAMILDLGLPDEDGMRLLARLRAAGCALPILVLTARDAVADRVAGLQAGADDYLLKPFDLAELAARLRALGRRAGGRGVDAMEDGPLRLDPARGEAWLHGRPLSLARRELALLAALMQARDRILSAEQLKDRLYDYSEEIESNALNVHIHHLRRKLGPDIVETVRGLGYRYGRAAP
ncbi:DNA-binding response regulator [Chromobacterium sphagni]|uniref:DNA-binding response regulator n=1 Tax=Chromobacterium sphagni TaxID=1903179 RepID=A0A1S1WV94_9NEIS|nr:response regulator [Chromobacterium sphagni]OHX11192.1 DNA-binding response regulator [Chromobacterium sphagni]